jgi:hypothetical protein
VEWLLDNVADLVAWRHTDSFVELELITGGGDPLPEDPLPVLILTLRDMVSTAATLHADLSQLVAEGVWNLGHETVQDGVRVTLEGEGWWLELACRTLDQQRLPLQAHHYERMIKRQQGVLDDRCASEDRMRRRIGRIEAFLDQQVDRAERILRQASPDRPEPRLRAEGRLRLAQELRTILRESDEPS